MCIYKTQKRNYNYNNLIQILLFPVENFTNPNHRSLLDNKLAFSTNHREADHYQSDMIVKKVDLWEVVIISL